MPGGGPHPHGGRVRLHGDGGRGGRCAGAGRVAGGARPARRGPDGPGRRAHRRVERRGRSRRCRPDGLGSPADVLGGLGTCRRRRRGCDGRRRASPRPGRAGARRRAARERRGRSATSGTGRACARGARPTATGARPARRPDADGAHAWRRRGPHRDRGAVPVARPGGGARQRRRRHAGRHPADGAGPGRRPQRPRRRRWPDGRTGLRRIRGFHLDPGAGPGRLLRVDRGPSGLRGRGVRRRRHQRCRAGLPAGPRHAHRLELRHQDRRRRHARGLPRALLPAQPGVARPRGPHLRPGTCGRRLLRAGSGVRADAGGPAAERPGGRADPDPGVDSAGRLAHHGHPLQRRVQLRAADQQRGAEDAHRRRDPRAVPQLRAAAAVLHDRGGSGVAPPLRVVVVPDPAVRADDRARDAACSARSASVGGRCTTSTSSATLTTTLRPSAAWT